MHKRWSSFESGLLTSRVARRVFTLFILCALIPVTILGLVSYFQVRSELVDQTEEDLRRTAKLAGMGILQRLVYLDADLSRFLRTNTLDSHTRGSLDIELLAESASRFSSLHLLDDESSIAEFPQGSAIDLHDLELSQKKRLETGSLVMTHAVGHDSFVVSILHPTGSAGEILLATIHPHFLWEIEGVLADYNNLVVLNSAGKALYSLEDPDAALTAWRDRQDDGTRRIDWRRDGEEYSGASWTLFMEHDFGTEWCILLGLEKDIAFAVLDDFSIIFFLVIALTLFVVLYLSLSQIRRQLIPIGQLASVTKKLSTHDFSERVVIETEDEFAELGESFNSMADSLERHIDLVRTTNEIGIRLSAERDPKNLIDRALTGLRRVTRADGASIYTLGEDGRLDLTLMTIGSLVLRIDVPAEMPIPASAGTTSFLEDLPLWAEQALCVSDVAKEQSLSPSPFQTFEQKHGYAIRSLLSFPLKDHQENIIGLIHLFNKCDEANVGTNSVTGFSEDDSEVALSLATQTAVALTKNRLVRSFQVLFESMTRMITTAIDEKSPYTGNHCQRVPVIAMMLAEAVCETDEGRLQDYELTPEELYELEIAALLHDCGKVTTPVHVMDKATKLETIFDRVELLRTRFLAFKSQRQLAYATGDLPTSIGTTLEGELREIDDDLAFLEGCNTGREWMSGEMQARVHAIANKYQWESPHGTVEPILTEEEVLNLTISRGTLNDGEREIINNHVVVTQKMLDMLNYPTELKGVPEIAGNHHEKLNGKGYPRGLSAEKLSTRDRILIFADIFEALTSKDRPYKDGKKLSEVFRILDAMATAGELDRTILDVFIRQNVHVRYAENYLDSNQVDETDFSSLLGERHGEGQQPERRSAA